MGNARFLFQDAEKEISRLPKPKKFTCALCSAIFVVRETGRPFAAISPYVMLRCTRKWRCCGGIFSLFGARRSRQNARHSKGERRRGRTVRAPRARSKENRPERACFLLCRCRRKKKQDLLRRPALQSWSERCETSSEEGERFLFLMRRPLQGRQLVRGDTVKRVPKRENGSGFGTVPAPRACGGATASATSAPRIPDRPPVPVPHGRGRALRPLRGRGCRSCT